MVIAAPQPLAVQKTLAVAEVPAEGNRFGILPLSRRPRKQPSASWNIQTVASPVVSLPHAKGEANTGRTRSTDAPAAVRQHRGICDRRSGASLYLLKGASECFEKN